MATNKDIELSLVTLLKKHKTDKWAGDYELIEKLNGLIEKSDANEKEVIIEYLTKAAIQQEWYFPAALQVLQDHCTPGCLRAIYEKAKSFSHSDFDIIHYLWVLGRQGGEEHRPLLEEFLLSDPLNTNQSFVQWAVYPKFPDLFAMAYSKYLIETSFAKWTGSGIVQAFMRRPNALKVLKSYLEKKNKEVWLQFRADIAAELKKDIWTRKEKTAIQKVI